MTQRTPKSILTGSFKKARESLFFGFENSRARFLPLIISSSTDQKKHSLLVQKSQLSRSAALQSLSHHFPTPTFPAKLAALHTSTSSKTEMQPNPFLWKTRVRGKPDSVFSDSQNLSIRVVWIPAILPFERPDARVGLC
jgi:hypothetical protein